MSQSVSAEAPLFSETNSFRASIVALFQPVVASKEGRVLGFEMLARVRDGDRLITPKMFLPDLDGRELLDLFLAMMGQGSEFLQALPSAADVYIAINANASLIMQDDFSEIVRFNLACHNVSATKFIIEVLEGEAVADNAALARSLCKLKIQGFTIALDDVGSAYSSLLRVKDLPIDQLKLDQDFSLGLARKPEDLQFILSLLGLARGLGRRLVVEGVESSAILNALTILGVEYVQGYVVAPPMAASVALAWLKHGSRVQVAEDPTSLLGVYAAHLAIVEARHLFESAPFKLRWHDDAADPHCCRIGRYLDQKDLRKTPLGRAHTAFHSSLALEQQRSRDWREAAEEFRDHLLAALRLDFDSMSPSHVAAPRS